MTPSLRRRRDRRHFGLYRATVVEATDPQQSGRVQVTVPSLSGSAPSWAGTLRDLRRPEAGDEVLVAFEAGDPARPYVIGVLASGGPATVELSDEHGNAIRLSPSGVAITSGSEVRITAGSTIRLASSAGQADSGMWSFSGVVKSQTLITESVVASSYTPGSGNVM
jgi:Type VI secretion system/phage-baseplate injector OB domain/Protein of unknown function (DUF3540)